MPRGVRNLPLRLRNAQRRHIEWLSERDNPRTDLRHADTVLVCVQLETEIASLEVAIGHKPGSFSIEES